MKCRNLLQAPPAARDPGFLVRHVLRVQLVLGKCSRAGDRRKIRINNELRGCGIAAEVPFAQHMQLLRRYLAQHVAEIEIGVRDLLHFLSTDIAEVTLFAKGHGRSSLETACEPQFSREPLASAIGILHLTERARQRLAAKRSRRGY